MASFSAQLLVAGQRYPVRQCTYEFTQATGPRGRAMARVRTGLVYLTLDVPADDVLLDWAATPNKPLAGQVVFLAAQGGSALETLGWETGQCVGYQEEFVSGDQQAGAYVCHLTIAAPKLTIQPGGPLVDSDPASTEPNGTQAYVNNPLGPVFLLPEVAVGVAEAAPILESLVLPTVEELLAAAVKRLLAGVVTAGSVAAAPVALTLGLILASTTPTAANDTIPQPPLLPLDPKVARLQALTAKQVPGTLTQEEEAELLDLLAKIKGIHIQTLEDLVRNDPEQTGQVPLGQTDLGRLALLHRLATNSWHNGNVTVFEYRDATGKLQQFVQSTIPTTGSHAERLALKRLEDEKVPFSSVTRIYSELEPCEVPDGGLKSEGCKAMVEKAFPQAKVTYSYEYKGRGQDTRPSRLASIKQREADFTKFKSIKL